MSSINVKLQRSSFLCGSRKPWIASPHVWQVPDDPTELVSFRAHFWILGSENWSLHRQTGLSEHQWSKNRKTKLVRWSIQQLEQAFSIEPLTIKPKLFISHAISSPSKQLNAPRFLRGLNPPLFHHNHRFYLPWEFSRPPPNVHSQCGSQPDRVLLCQWRFNPLKKSSVFSLDIGCHLRTDWIACVEPLVRFTAFLVFHGKEGQGDSQLVSCNKNNGWKAMGTLYSAGWKAAIS